MNKPALITELEKETKLSFLKVGHDTILREKWLPSPEYYINNEGEIVGLSMSKCKLKTIPRSILLFKRLEILNLSNNYITDISIIKKFKSISQLRLENNFITDLSALCNLNLKGVHVKNNPILVFPETLDGQVFDIDGRNQRYNENYLLFYDFPYNAPPLKMIKQGDQAIINWVNINKISIKDIEKQAKVSLTYCDKANKIIDVPRLVRSHCYMLDEEGDIVGLSLHMAGLRSIPSSIKHLTKLKYINLGCNVISSIDELEQLKKLQKLNLNLNKLSNSYTLKKIGRLNKLTELYIHENELSNSDILFLENLTNLEVLGLEWNRISKINVLKHLKNLRVLYLSSNHIVDISSLTNLKKLSILYLGHNQIKDISPLQSLINIKRLGLNSNKKINDITPIQNSKEIEQINLVGTGIEILPEWIWNLQNIHEVNYYMKDNIVRKNTIGLAGSNIKEPPIDIINQGKTAVKDYFANKRITETELKLILTGNSRAGKTTLLEFMKDPKVFTEEESTHGITVENIKWKNFNLNVWDFGGQDYYHATHRLFLTNNAVYILVWEHNSNKTEKKETLIPIENELQNLLLQNYDYEHWLTVIRKYDDLGRKNSIDEEQKKHHSPVIMLQNKIDDIENGNNEIETLGRIKQQKYKIAKEDLFAVSIKETQRNWKNTERYAERYVNEYRRFEKRLQELIKRELHGRQVLEYDVAIRAAIRKRTENIISFSDYRRMCNEATKTVLERPITEIQIRFATERFHNQGILIYYDFISGSSLLKDNVFIKPQYVTDTIYQILNRKVKESEGKFSFDDVEKIFIDRGASEEEAKYDAELFIDLMQSPNFELIFKYDTNIYYATQYLREELDENRLILFEQQSETYDLAFVLRYDGFFSQSIISRIIARYGFGIKQYKGKDIFWKYGLPFVLDGESFWVYCEFEEKKIYLKAQKGDKSQNIYDIYTEILRISENDESIKVSFDNSSFSEIKNINKKDFLPMKKAGNVTDNSVQVTIEGDNKGHVIIHSPNTNITQQQISNLEEDFISKLTDKLKSEFEDIKNVVSNESRSNLDKVLKELTRLINQNQDKLDEKHLAFFEQIQKDKGLQTKAKISAVIPLLPLLGINIGFETEQSLNGVIKKFGTRLIKFLEKSSTSYPKHYYGRM